VAGEQIGPYVLLGQVDAPDGLVWKAQEATTGLVVALRLLPGDASGTTYVVQNWLTGAGLGTVTAGSAAAAGGAAGAGAAGTAASAGGAAGAGAAGTAASAGGAAGAGAAGTAASAGGAGLHSGGSPAAGGTPGSTATSGATGTAAHAGGGSGGAAGTGVAAPGGHPAAGAKGVLGHIAEHKALATIAAVVVAGGIAGAALVAAAGDDEPERRIRSESTPPTTALTTSAPSSSAPPTLSEEESAAVEIEGRYTITFAGGTVAGTPFVHDPDDLSGVVARVVSDCSGSPCAVRVTTGGDVLSGTGTYDDGAWSGSGNYAMGCTEPFAMRLTPSGRNLTLKFVLSSGSSCFSGGAADLRYKLTPSG